MKKIFFMLSTAFLLANDGFCLNSVWTAPVKIASLTNSEHPAAISVAIDANSNAIVGWLDGVAQGELTEVYSAVFPSGATEWNAAELVFSHSPPRVTANPHVSTDVNGNQIVVWEEVDFLLNQLRFNITSRALGSSGWSSPVTIALSEVNAAGGAQVDNLGNGVVAVATATNLLPPYSVVLAGIPAGASEWNFGATIGTDNEAPAVVGSSISEGRSVVVWKTDYPVLSLKSLGYLFNNNNIVSYSDIPLPEGTLTVRNVQVTNDTNGNAVAFFTVVSNAEVNQAYASTLVAGSNTWSSPVIVSSSRNNGSALSVQLNDISTATLLWAEFSPQDEGFIFVADIDLQGILNNRTQLAGAIEGVVSIESTSNVSVDGLGNTAAAWGYTTERNATVQVATRTAGRTWSQITTLTTAGLNPSVALSAQGTAISVWTDANNKDLMSATNLAPADELLPL